MVSAKICGLRGLEPSQELVAEYRSVLERNIAAYETILGKQKYLAGDVCTRRRSITGKPIHLIITGPNVGRLDASAERNHGHRAGRTHGAHCDSQHCSLVEGAIISRIIEERSGGNASFDGEYVIDTSSSVRTGD